MRNLILSMMLAFDGFLGGSNRYRQSMDEGFNQRANDLLFAYGLLTLILLFAGGVKLVLPLGVLTEHIPVPDMLVRFIGVAEVFGAMFLARLSRIRPA